MNALVGEKKIVLSGTEYLLRPSFQAFIEIEELAGSSMVAILDRFVARDYKFSDCVAILFACMTQGDPKLKVTKDRVGELVFDAGMNAVVVTCFELISTLYTGIEKKVEATPA